MAPDASKKGPAQDPPLKNKKIKLVASVGSSRTGTPASTGDGAHKATKPPTSATGLNSDGVETQQCKHCKKYVPKEGFTQHSKQCLRDKKERKRQKELQAAAAQAEIDKTGERPDAEGDVVMDDTITVTSSLPGGSTRDENLPLAATSATAPKKKADPGAGDENAKKTKKRKAEEAVAAVESSSKPPTKKQKKKEEAAKPKAAKPKGPVDVEKQCGVQMDNGNLCARSLTCKSHAMGAKRAVPGRSAPYDHLLAQYQKKNQAKQQKAAIASNAPLADDFDAQAGPVDSDEERDAVMAGIARANPKPLISRPMVSTSSRYANIRIKEMLSNALGGQRGSSLFATERPDDGDASSLMQATRPPMFGQQQQHFTQASIPSAG